MRQNVKRISDDQDNFDRIYWALFAFAVILMLAGVTIELFYYYLPRMERSREKAQQAIVKAQEDLNRADKALESLPTDVRGGERTEIEKSRDMLEVAEDLYDKGELLNADSYEKAQAQAMHADSVLERIITNGNDLGTAYVRVMETKESQLLLTEIADYCDLLETAYPKAAVPVEIINKAGSELVLSAANHYGRLRGILENNRAWEADLTANQNTSVTLQAARTEETEFLDRMSSVARRTRQKDQMVRLFYLLYRVSREAESYGRVKVRPDTAANLLEYWASDLNKVREHNAKIESDLSEAEKLLRFIQAG